MAPNKPGTVKLDVFVKSDSYIGLDQQKAVEFEVISAATLPQYEPHPDDLELDNEPTLFEQVMQAYDDETDSEDEVSRKGGVLSIHFFLLAWSTAGSPCEEHLVGYNASLQQYAGGERKHWSVFITCLEPSYRTARAYVSWAVSWI